jgi:hypothetical protein
VHVRVSEGLSPGVQNGQSADPCAEVLGIDGDDQQVSRTAANMMSQT